MNDLHLSTEAWEPSISADGADDVGQRTQRMYQQIVAALTEQRIAPGTRLREERLASLYAVSRTQVRKVLQLLEHEGLVQRQPNRGVTVFCPDPEETRDIFEARRLIEPWVVTRLCEHCDRSSALGLRRLVREENKAHQLGDRRTAVRLSGEFHRALAQAAGNRAIAKSVEALSLRTCLAILTNQAPMAVTCREDEHDKILAAIEAGDARLATRLMLSHLKHIESAMQAPAALQPTDDLAVLLETEPASEPRQPRARKTGART